MTNVLIGVIGGSGLYHLDNLTFVKHVNPETPWGFPSSPIAICSLPTGTQIAFLARHGKGHTISPSSVPSRANISALKSLGVRAIIAFSAVGSLREEIRPGSFVLPTQIIDRTKGIRPASFFEGTHVVAHAAFGDPFSLKLVRWLEGRIEKALEGRDVGLFTDKTIVCMEGPQFSTRAESLMYRQWGGDLINMSVLPEAKLAREAELSYALIATATDYDSWRPHSDSVTAAEVFKTLQSNADTSRHVAATVLDELHNVIDGGGGEEQQVLLEQAGSMKYSIMPRHEKTKEEDRLKLAFILPEYFRELEELEALKANQLEEDADNYDGFVSKPVPTFAQVWSQLSGQSDSQESDHGGESESRKGKKKKKKKKKTTVVESPSTPHPTTQKQKKASKKQKEKEKKSGTTMDELDQALAELSIKYPEIQTQLSTPSSSTTTTATQFNSKLLAVSLSHLDSEAELRKFFGSKVVQANKDNASSSSSSSSHGNRRGRQAVAIRSHLTKPKPTWWAAKQREGLSIRAYTDQEVVAKVERCGWGDGVDEKWWTVEYSKKYKSMTKAFIRTVLSGDPQGFWDLIGKLPWHADTLLQLAEIYRHREEWAQAVDFVDRALFTYERSFIGAFDFTSGQNRLDFDMVENRPFFLALHRQITDLQRRGCVRTAFEFSRLMYSLDPWSDPHGALFHLDFLALKAQGMNQWLLDVYDNFLSRRKNRASSDTRADPSVLPGWAYSRALAMWMVEDARKDKDHKASSEALKEAVVSFPSVVPLLADKIEAQIPGTIRAHVNFKVQVDGAYMSYSDSMLHMLSHLYAQHAFGIWKEPAHAEWFTSVVTSLALPSSSLPVTPQRQEFIRLYNQSENLRYSAYRHIIVQEPTYRRLLSFIPKQVTEIRSLACDPLPPPSAVSRYDEEFFAGVEDAFESGMFGPMRQRRRQQQRGGEQNALLRQLQEIFNANPQIAERFPGGLWQLEDAVEQMHPEMLEDILVQLDAAALEAQQHGGMPGNFGEEEAVDGPAVVVPQAAEQVELDGERNNEGEDEDEDEEDEEEVSPFMRGLRNILGRFLPRNNTGDGDSGSDDDETETEPVDGTGVD